MALKIIFPGGNTWVAKGYGEECQEGCNEDNRSFQELASP
jgi:hypothetical protein